MNKIPKPIKIIFNIFKYILIIILVIILLGIATGYIYTIYNNIRENKLRKENTSYIEEYLKNNLKEDEIISIEQEKYIPAFLDGGHYEPVNEDDPSEEYIITYTCYDKKLQLQYNIVFSHEEYEKIKLSKNEKIDYMNNYNIYELNYKLIESVINQSGGISINLGKYRKKDNLDKYILLIYTPNVEATKSIIDKCHKEVCGKSASDVDETTHFVNIDMPRYIFCNDKKTYDEMIKNKNKINEYLEGKNYNYNVERSKTREDTINLSEIIQILLENKINKFKVKENIKPQMYKLEKYITDNETWIITYELEIGINYYLDTYVLK